MFTGDAPSVKYTPPCVGTMYMHVSDDFSSRATFRVARATDHFNMMEVVRKGVDNVSTVLEYCIQNSYFRLREARHIYNIMFLEMRDTAKVLSKVLPRMASTEEAKQLMLQHISFDKVALRNLERMLGNALGPILGQWNGYYNLDLSIEMDRVALIKLLVQNEAYQTACKAKCAFKNGTTGDLSQHGDWSAFRNAVINGVRAHLSAELFKPIPVKGLVSFDFCGDTKAPRNAVPIRDKRCVNLLLNLGLVQYHLKDKLDQEMEANDILARSSIYGNGTYLVFNDSRRAENIQECMCKFYDRLLLRTDEYRNARSLEEDKFSADGGMAGFHMEEEEDSDNDSTDSLSHIVFDDSESALVEQQREIDITRLEMGTVPLSCHSKYENIENRRKKQRERRGGLLHTETSMREVGNRIKSDLFRSKLLEQALPTSPEAPTVVPGRGSKLVLPALAKTDTTHTMSQAGGRPAGVGTHTDAKTMGASEHVDDNDLSVKARRIYSTIVAILCRVYIKAKHLATISRWYFIGRHHRTRHFGSYRVELIIALFSRVVDIHNFDLVLRTLQPFEHAHVLCRLGILHVFNPLNPEGSICLNMSSRDERQIAKMLIVLKLHERGDNWQNQKYRWEFESVSMPGWELTQPWLVNDTMPEKGFLSLSYGSGNGATSSERVADVTLRKSLLCLVSHPLHFAIACFTCMSAGMY